MMKIGAACVLTVAIAFYVWHISQRPAVFELYVFDTPGAQSLFMRTEDDRRILVHGGSNSDIVRRVTSLLPFYSRRIDTVVALDDDPKHITGLIEIVGRYEVGSVILDHATSSSPAFGVLLDRIAENGIATSSISAGEYVAATPLVVYDVKRSVFTFTAQGQTVLIVPFNPNSVSKKMLEATQPDYVIYSAALTSTAKPKSDLLAGIMQDRRFNIRRSGGVRVTVRPSAAVADKKAPSGARLNIEEIQ